MPGLVKALKNTTHKGQHNAMCVGIETSQGQHIITIDADLQQPPEAIPAMYDMLKNENKVLVYGMYERKKGSRLEQWAVEITHFIIRISLRTPQNASNYKLFDKKLAKGLLGQYHKHIFLDPHLVYQIPPSKVGFVNIQHTKRKVGQSSYNFTAYFKLLFRFLYSCFMAKMKLPTDKKIPKA